MLFFNGLYSIFIKEYDLALQILKTLKTSEDKETGIYSFIKKQRLNEILLRLFTFNAIEKYIEKKEIDSAFNLLKECETLFKENHFFSFSNYITMSRIYFEKGNLIQSKKYTEKARALKKFRPEIYCNLGFFGMVDNNPEQVFQNYWELSHSYKYLNKLNYLEIVHFIELYRNDYPNSQLLFDFGIASLNFLYVDKRLGIKQLNSLKDELKLNLNYTKIYDLTILLLNKGEIKSPYFRRDKKRKA